MILSLPLIGYVLKAAIRDRLVISLMVMLLLGASLSVFLGSSAVVERDYFSVVFAAGGLRIVGVLGLVLFTVTFVRRSFDGKDIEFLLSRPIGRAEFILSYATAFTLMATVLALAVFGVVISVAPHLFSIGHGLWAVSIVAEYAIMVNAALFFGLYISSAASASMATLAFYVLGRMMGQFLGIIDSSLVDSQGPTAMAVQLVSLVTPRLDLLGQTSWLLYGMEGSFGFIYACIQGGLFCLLILLAAIWDLLERQF